MFSSGGQSPNLTIQQASGTQAGYLSSTDWTTFNSKANNSPFVGDSGSGGSQGLVPGPTAGQAEQGNFLQAGGSFSFVDVSKPRYPSFKFLSATPEPAGTIKAQNVVLYTYQNNTYALVSGGSTTDTIYVYNVTNPASPQLRGALNLAGTYSAIVYFSAGVPWAIVPSSGSSRLYTVNLSNPNSLAIGGNILISGAPGSLYTCVAANGYVYISTQNAGLTVVDIGGGAGSMLLPVQTYQEGAVKSLGVAISGSTLYTTNYQTTFPATVRYLKTWSLATPSTPSLQNTFTIPGGPVATSTKPGNLSISGSTAIVADLNQNTFDIIDITTPTAPSYLSYFTPSATLQANSTAQFSGNYVYVSSGGNATYGGVVDFFDITNRATPVKISSAYQNVANSVYGGCALGSGYVFVANYGVAPGAAGTLDIYSTAFETLTAGQITVGSLTAIEGITATITGTATNITATSNSTLVTLSALSLPGSQVTGNIAGNAANITATSNSTLTTLLALSLPGSQVTGNISGTASNITATSNSTLVTLSALSLPGSQVSGDIAGNAANITATSNSTLTTLSALSLPGTQVSGNIAGTASNITATSNSTLTTLSVLSLPFSQTTGTVPVNRGGTNLTAAPANGQLLIGNGTGYTLATLTAGSGIGIVNTAGAIQINNTLTSNIDGGQANSNYGGITPINAGGAT
jgi:hypothetical protein